MYVICARILDDGRKTSWNLEGDLLTAWLDPWTGLV